MAEIHPHSVYGKCANECDFSECEKTEFKEISLKLAEIDRSVSCIDQTVVRHEDAMENITSILRTIQDSQTEMSHTLARMLVRFRKQAYNKHKVEELVRCNKELAKALSKKLYMSEFKHKKIPYDESAMEGAIHPNALPFVYLETHPSEDEEDLYEGITALKRK